VSDDIIQVVNAEDVQITEQSIRTVIVHLFDRPAVEHKHLGKAGQRFMPMKLRMVYSRTYPEPWTVDVRMTVALIMKSGRLSDHIRQDIGFERIVPGPDRDYARSVYGCMAWPRIELPAYVTELVEAYAPVAPHGLRGWQL
jgi:hypothetical protein